MRSIHPQIFITIASIAFEICSRQKSRMNKKRAKTQNLGKQELRFMCTALPLDEIYPPTIFHNHSLYSLGDMHRTKLKYKKQRAITQTLSKQKLRFICTVLPLDKIYPPTKFHNHSKYSFGDMHRTKLTYGSKQRAMTKKISKQELRFMCTALPLDEIYPSKKFHNNSKYSFGDMFRTKFTYENKQTAITQKLSKRELWFLCTALPLDEIYPPTKFHNHS